MAGLCYDTPSVEAMPFPVAMLDKTPCALSEDVYQEKRLEGVSHVLDPSEGSSKLIPIHEEANHQ
jgi:hypothetical protein